MLYSVTSEDDGSFNERFFILSHDELAAVQGERNCPGESLSYVEIAARSPKGVDNVLIRNVEDYEDAWSKIIDFCNA